LLPLLIFAGIVGFTGAFISLFLSKWMAKFSHNIKLFDYNNISSLSSKEKLVFDIVEKISSNNNIKMPEVGIYESPEPNAFATGATKNSSLVAVSTGLLDLMTEDEIEGVISHEMAHILNGDMITMTLIQGVINSFVIFLSRIIASVVDNYLKSNDENASSGPSWVYYVVSIVLEIIFGILASLLVMWFSRHREFKADLGGAQYSSKQKMISALKKLQLYSDKMLTDDTDKLATMKIGSKKRGGFFALFSSHPDLGDRIRALEESNVY
ncbi:MAG: protease HtpX, partial [Candidatus Gracilibacteria bacterium]|nr:protease HtpX [Candidatus Gracilibacteria bacterium]